MSFDRRVFSTVGLQLFGRDSCEWEQPSQPVELAIFNAAGLQQSAFSEFAVSSIRSTDIFHLVKFSKHQFHIRCRFRSDNILQFVIRFGALFSCDQYGCQRPVRLHFNIIAICARKESRRHNACEHAKHVKQISLDAFISNMEILILQV